MLTYPYEQNRPIPALRFCFDAVVDLCLALLKCVFRFPKNQKNKKRILKTMESMPETPLIAPILVSDSNRPHA